MTEQAGEATRERLAAALRPWINWRRKRFWLLVAIILYTLLGFFAAPPLIRWLIVSTVEDTGRTATVETIKVNPYTLTLRTGKLEVRDPDDVIILSHDELYVNFQATSLFRWAWTFREIRLAGLYVHEERFTGFDTRFTRLIKALTPETEDPAPTEEAGELPRLILDRFQLQEGRFTLTDQVAGGFEGAFGPVNMEINDLRTLPDSQGEHTVSIQTADGGKIEWRGTLRLVPFQSRGHLTVTGKGLADAFRYADHFLPFRVSGDSVDIALDYTTGFDQESAFLAVDKLQARGNDTRIRPDKADRDTLRTASIEIEGGSLKWPEQTARIEKITVDEAVLNASLLSDGTVDLLALMPVDPDAAEATEKADQAATGDRAPADSAPWKVEIGTLEIPSALVNLTDATLTPPFEMSLESLQLSLSNIDNQDGTEMPLELSTQLSTGGSVLYSGVLQALPDLRTQGQVNLDDIELAVAQAYIEPLLRIELKDGSLDLSAELVHNPEQPAAVQGDLRIENLAVHDQARDEKLLAWDALQLDRFEADVAANRVVTSTMQFDGLFGRLHIAEDLTTNVSGLVVEPGKAAPTADAQAEDESETAPMPDIQLGGVELKNAELDFSDFSLPLPFRTRIQNLNGEISTLSTTSSEPSSVSLEGQVNDFGQAKIDGEIKPLDPTDLAHIDMTFRNLDLSRLTPYTVQFAGYAIDEGRMDLDLGYRVDQRKLNGKNNIVIRDIVLGEKIEHPDAGSLPLRLAVALLTDVNGVIDLELPVEGDLDDPEFRIGSIVWQALGNLITKAVTAPFRLLGKLVGVDSEDFGTLHFAPGRSDISPPDREQLLKLAEAMAQRPELTVEVGGVYASEADTAALQKQAVDAQVEQRSSELPIGKDELSTDHERRVLESLAAEQLPALDLTTVQAGFSTTPEDSKAPVLDLPAYVANLRQRLEAAQTVGESELLTLARARAEAALAALRENQPEAGLNAVAGEAKAVQPDKPNEIPLELGVSAGN